MIYGSLVCTPLLHRNKIFDPEQELNSDGLFDFMVMIRERLLEKGIELNTEDLKKPSSFEIYLEGRRINRNSLPKYLIALESPLIDRFNGDKVYWSLFNKVFSWIDGSIMFPSRTKFLGTEKKDIFSVMISGNKSGQELYEERKKVIDFYGKSNLFRLYGRGWETGYGEIENKSEILKRARFSWCYENSRQKNYITEKIFDCFTSGCVPIYYGAPNISDFVPNNCFIDRSKFKSTDEVHEFLMSLPDTDEYLSNIKDFLPTAGIFSHEHCAETIVNFIGEIHDCQRERNSQIKSPEWET